jgi:hypothetical protein
MDEPEIGILIKLSSSHRQVNVRCVKLSILDNSSNNLHVRPVTALSELLLHNSKSAMEINKVDFSIPESLEPFKYNLHPIRASCSTHPNRDRPQMYSTQMGIPVQT